MATEESCEDPGILTKPCFLLVCFVSKKNTHFQTDVLALVNVALGYQGLSVTERLLGWESKIKNFKNKIRTCKHTHSNKWQLVMFKVFNGWKFNQSGHEI